MNKENLCIVPMVKKVEFKDDFCEIEEFLLQKFDFAYLEASLEILNCKTSTNPNVYLNVSKDVSCEKEGYILDIQKKKIEITSNSEIGLFYGLITLKQLFNQSKIPCCIIEDYPDLVHRGYQLTLVQAHVSYRKDYLEYLVKELALQKINYLYLYLETYFEFAHIKGLGGKGVMTQSHAIELDRLCIKYGITLIPQINVLGHAGEILATEKYHDITEYKKGDLVSSTNNYNYCATNPNSWNIIKTIIDDISDSFSSDIIHVGGDEVELLGECPLCFDRAQEIGKFNFYVEYFAKISDYLKAKNKKMGIWGDMILNYSQKMTIDEFSTSLNPIKAAIIYDWNYNGSSRGSLEKLSKLNVCTIACSSTNLCYTSAMSPLEPVKQKVLYKEAKEANCFGAMATTWFNAYGLHEEVLAYLRVSNAALLWDVDADVGIDEDSFNKAFCLQTYGIDSKLLCEYLKLVGDCEGEILSLLKPLNGSNLRKNIFHTDNILKIWFNYSTILNDDTLKTFAKVISKAEKLWDEVEKEYSDTKNKYFWCQKAPLIIYKDFLCRFSSINEAYKHYNAAAKAQFEDDNLFNTELTLVCDNVKNALSCADNSIAFLEKMTEDFGLELGSIYRLKKTKEKAQELIDFINQFRNSDRLLPSFIAIDQAFMRNHTNNWAVDRAHDWVMEKEPFVRYSIQEGIWPDNPFKLV